MPTGILSGLELISARHPVPGRLPIPARPASAGVAGQRPRRGSVRSLRLGVPGRAGCAARAAAGPGGPDLPVAAGAAPGRVAGGPQLGLVARGCPPRTQNYPQDSVRPGLVTL